MISTDFENFRTELKTVYQARKAILDVVEEYLDLIGNSEELAKIDLLKEVAFSALSSDLINDAGFITQADVPTHTSELVNDSGFITQAQVPVYTAGEGIEISNNEIGLENLAVVNGKLCIKYEV